MKNSIYLTVPGLRVWEFFLISFSVMIEYTVWSVVTVAVFE